MKSECLAIFDGLEKERKELLSKVDACSEEQRQYSPETGGWNTLQVLDHLYQAEQLTTVYIERSLSRRAKPEKTGLSAGFKLFLLKAALWLPFKYKAPEVVDATGKEINYEGLKEGWDEVRTKLKKLIEENSSDDLARQICKHPAIGLINMKQGLKFMQFHFRHHREQIQRLLRHQGRPVG